MIVLFPKRINCSSEIVSFPEGNIYSSKGFFRSLKSYLLTRGIVFLLKENSTPLFSPRRNCFVPQRVFIYSIKVLFRSPKGNYFLLDGIISSHLKGIVFLYFAFNTKRLFFARRELPVFAAQRDCFFSGLYHVYATPDRFENGAKNEQNRIAFTPHRGRFV